MVIGGMQYIKHGVPGSQVGIGEQGFFSSQKLTAGLYDL